MKISFSQMRTLIKGTEKNKFDKMEREIIILRQSDCQTSSRENLLGISNLRLVSNILSKVKS